MSRQGLNAQNGEIYCLRISSPEAASRSDRGVDYRGCDSHVRAAAVRGQFVRLRHLYGHHRTSRIFAETRARGIHRVLVPGAG